jgi:hypothetical protein
MKSNWFCVACGTKWYAANSLECPRADCRSRSIQRIDRDTTVESKPSTKFDRQAAIEKYGDKNDI